MAKPNASREAEQRHDASAQRIAQRTEPKPLAKAAPLVPDRVVATLRAMGRLDAVEASTMARGLTVHEAFATRARSVSYAYARACAYAALRAAGWSYPEIGRLCGCDHTTVMHALGATIRTRRAA